MDRLQQAVSTLHDIDREAEKRSRSSRIHPVSRVLVSVLFTVITVSFHKYDFFGLLSMVLFLIILSIWEDISLMQGIKRVRYILILLFFIGIANPFLDHSVLFVVGDLPVTGGMVSMATLFLKGAFSVSSGYFLVVCVGIDGICQALASLHIPKQGITMVLLIYRYLIVFLKEVQRMLQAYHLRAPKQKGIQMSAWGSFVGLLLLRSIDRAKEIYDSMLLRGYNGSNQRSAGDKRYSAGQSVLYVIAWLAVLIGLRLFPIFQVVGQKFVM